MVMHHFVCAMTAAAYCRHQRRVVGEYCKVSSARRQSIRLPQLGLQAKTRASSSTLGGLARSAAQTAFSADL